MSILVTGGAGYVGSHCVAVLHAAGEDVVVLDDLMRGHRAAVNPKIRLYAGSLSDPVYVGEMFRRERIEAVFHFASLSLAGESMKKPGRYFLNNVAGTVNLLEVMCAHGCPPLVFSSTAAVYGHPTSNPIREDALKRPMSPYGESKLMVENVLKWYDAAYGLRHVAFRYFNVAGAVSDGGIGEDHRPETHLVPIVLRAAREKTPVKVFGTDYQTPDGTCVRDYIHVEDLVDAHLAALQYLRGGGVSDVFNLGLGHGFSVREIIETARRVTGAAIPAEAAPRRPGDPAELVALTEKAERVLGWKPKHLTPDEIIASAWRWHRSHSEGY
ncbi:MAG: UDP-glucose 4-epimerase GalE [Oscillospiraceae bacterium]|jgi:UDP-glucose 4-epimerase|nr:UDP-glucose 4-epimerase GalE [Oscillospiraceae bacterium]